MINMDAISIQAELETERERRVKAENTQDLLRAILSEQQYTRVELQGLKEAFAVADRSLCQQGLQIRAIAANLGVTVGTVREHSEEIGLLKQRPDTLLETYCDGE
jgi:DNA-binding NarL/FixJ family response regulator